MIPVIHSVLLGLCNILLRAVLIHTCTHTYKVLGDGEHDFYSVGRGSIIKIAI